MVSIKPMFLYGVRGGVQGGVNFTGESTSLGSQLHRWFTFICESTSKVNQLHRWINFTCELTIAYIMLFLFKRLSMPFLCLKCICECSVSVIHRETVCDVLSCFFSSKHMAVFIWQLFNLWSKTEQYLHSCLWMRY